MTSASPVRRLADTLVNRLLVADPFSGTALGLREYDTLVPDPSAAAEAALDADLAGIAAQAETLDAQTPAERVTLAAVRATCRRRRLALEQREVEFTVTAMPMAGPPALFAIAARTTLPGAHAADDYLVRLRAAAAWIDGTTERLREGEARGRRPVRSLLDQALAWADRALTTPVPAAFTAPQPPDGWAGTPSWVVERDRIVSDDITPALRRWRDLLVELQPAARPDEQAGLGALPGGDEDYLRAIEVHTTLPFTADELHAIGLAEIERLEARAVNLGASLGLADLAAVVAAVRASSSEIDAETALTAARAAVLRAESRAGEIMPAPLPAPCAVEPMPPTVAEAGMPPHYTRPMRDGSRPGTFWFNTQRATAGTGWDLEAVAFHETVPGHHSQLARAQDLGELPLLQQMSVTVHSEGWGLYAERLAGEFGLYSDVRAELGSVYIELHRAARLVVDTGLHAFGWSRAKAVAFMVEHVALPEAFLADEIDRYIAWPGQALAYLSGLREILRLRALAEGAVGASFDLPSFNGALLDSGSVPMPVLATVVDDWIAARV
ncbi:MAG: hypothetical protein QOH52_3673 [Pseudonocardiales bacterium]|nr:hypothetical protein [Pseudonocardiales bacterium]